jgi:hypothetical protein
MPVPFEREKKGQLLSSYSSAFVPFSQSEVQVVTGKIGPNSFMDTDWCFVRGAEGARYLTSGHAYVQDERYAAGAGMR